MEQLVDELEQENEKQRREIESMRVLITDTTSIQSTMQLCQRTSQKINELKGVCEDEYNELLALQFLLDTRQTKLMYDLQSLYGLTRNVEGEFTLGGLDLPSDFSRDDDHISSVLGYLTHILLLGSKYLQIPLRYQLIYQSSRSMIRDPAVGNGTALPLYRSRGADKDRFDRAVNWLLRNLEQLLRSRGKRYDPKRGILQNLNNLFGCEACPKFAF